jgi:hypothetical protein
MVSPPDRHKITVPKRHSREACPPESGERESTSFRAVFGSGGGS